jgi:hypothetical protein
VLPCAIISPNSPLTYKIYPFVPRIHLNQLPEQMGIALSGGNPGCARPLAMLFNASPRVDPGAYQGPFTPWLLLDEYGIYGTDIYVLCVDICEGYAARALAVLRAVSLAILDRQTLREACGRQDCTGGELLGVLQLYRAVRERLPGFDVAGEAGYSGEELTSPPPLKPKHDTPFNHGYLARTRGLPCEPLLAPGLALNPEAWEAGWRTADETPQGAWRVALRQILKYSY